MSERVFFTVFPVNGPGTCVPIVFLSHILSILGLSSTSIVFVESF
ncbi:Oligosaccharide biosynthesis protein Alg14-like protein, partial [Aduncisulcus paluster]